MDRGCRMMMIVMMMMIYDRDDDEDDGDEDDNGDEDDDDDCDVVWLDLFIYFSFNCMHAFIHPFNCIQSHA